jgi:hypothetical protein
VVAADRLRRPLNSTLDPWDRQEATLEPQREPVDAEVAALERRLGLPEGFWANLAEEDDWSCVVKLNALIEAACTHALIARLRCPEIAEPLAHLELAGSKCGKTAFLSALGCITKQQTTFIRKLAEIRNDLVHNVANAGVNLPEYLAALEAGRRRECVKGLGYVFGDPVVHIATGKTTALAEFFPSNAKFVVLIAARDVLACLHLEYAIADFRAMEDELKAQEKVLNSMEVKGVPDLAELLASLQSYGGQGRPNEQRT